ncbi:MAG: tetraacyldisaccharide 4'-kinase [Pararhizobium sp.]
MVSEAPPFWWTEPGWQARGLSPLAYVYGRVARRRMENAPRARVGVPVLCVGNFTVGGAGKTPTAIALAARAAARGMKPGFLSRGYGAAVTGTVLVDPHRHHAHGVGDEPLLLAAAAPTVVTRNRLDGAKRLIAEGAGLIIMDDGFQSARLAIDYALLVVDARRGLGNGMMIPAGPVRAPVVDQLRRASALLTIGEGAAASSVVRLAGRAAKPVYEAYLKPRPLPEIAGRQVLAFAAIGDPEKFFRSLEGEGATIVQRRSFADHHVFTAEEAADLIAEADRLGLLPVTTAKDMMRLCDSHGAVADLARRTVVLEVDLVFDEPTVPDTILDATVAAFRKSRLAG